MRPINNIVDITNYVMLEWGQPLHAFDYDVLVQRAGGKAPTIIVRPAQAGETLTTLDGVERKLTPDNLVIADDRRADRPGRRHGRRWRRRSPATTTNILLESANFDFVSIRRTMRALNLPSEASLRFSRASTPRWSPPAAEPGRRPDAPARRRRPSAKGIVDAYPAPPPPQVVELHAGRGRAASSASTSRSARRRAS